MRNLFDAIKSKLCWFTLNNLLTEYLRQKGTKLSIYFQINEGEISCGEICDYLNNSFS